MKKLFALFIFFLTINASAQAYFPGFNDLFLNDPDESLFSPELNYFREELKAASKMLFVGDVQIATGSSSSFYSFKVLPRLTEHQFLNLGIFLKFNVNEKDKYASFPVIFDEFFNKEEATGNGRIDIENNGLLLAFDTKDIAIYYPRNKTPAKINKAEFIIKKIEYKIDKANLEIQLTGNFTTAIKVKGKKLKKEAISQLTVNATKSRLHISYIDMVSKKKKYLINSIIKS